MSLKEIVFISGKGGTGKTTITASSIPFFSNIVIADCDVDAPDLDILLKPVIINREDFISTSKAVINPDLCTNCGECIKVCNFNALIPKGEYPLVKEIYCEGCNTCTLVCKTDAISIKPYTTGVIFDSKTEYGDMIHARLNPGEEVSGRLVSEVRKKAKIRALETGADFIIIDGPPGIACNVISAITGTNLAVIVTEPTISGFHDLERVYETTKKLRVKTAVIINKDGMSKEYSEKIRNYCKENSIVLLGEIPLTKKILESINNREIPSIQNKNIFIENGWQNIINNIKNLI